jgi:hypothetical protein
VDNGVNVGGKRGKRSWCDGDDGGLLVIRDGLVIVVAVVAIVIVVFVVVVIVGANEGKVYFTAGGCCFCIEVDVGEEKAASAGADGR